MRLPVSAAAGFLFGLAIMAIPLAYLYGLHSSSGVSQDYILKAVQCERDAARFKEMITAVKGDAK